MGEGELGSDLVITRLSLGTLRDPGDDLLRVVSDAPLLFQISTKSLIRQAKETSEILTDKTMIFFFLNAHTDNASE